MPRPIQVRSIRYPIRFADERLVALVASLLPFSDRSRVLDVAAAYGCVSSILSERFPSVSVLATSWQEPATSALTAAKDRGAWDSVDIFHAHPADYSALATHSFSHVFHNQALALASTPAAQLSHLFRVLRPDGILVVTVALLNSWLVLWTQTVRETIDPSYSPQSLFHEGVCNCETLRSMLEGAGFIEVRAQTIVCPHSPDQNATAVIDDLFREHLLDLQALTPAMVPGDLSRVRPALMANITRRYAQSRREPANVMIWAVARRPALGGGEDQRTTSTPADMA